MVSNQINSITHNCGIAAIFAPGHDVSSLMLSLLYTLQHRGQEGSGMWVSNGKQGQYYKGVGWAKQVFTPEIINNLSSINPIAAIGQDRYSTSGDANAWQPFIDSNLALAHNGNFTNALELLGLLPVALQKKVESDTWIAHQLIINNKSDNLIDKIKDSVIKFEGAYNLVMEYEGKIYVVRDPWGFRPLVIGRLKDDSGYVVASESAAFGPIDAKFIREVREGECLVIDEKGIKTFFIDSRTKPHNISHCVFEFIYLSAPDSIIFNKHVSEVRYECGRSLALEDTKNGFLPEIIIPILGSGGAYGQGYAEEMIRQVCLQPSQFGISQEDLPDIAASLVPKTGLVTNYYSGRIFISPKFRENASILKHRVNEIDIRGKKVLVVDDSLVRGTTAKKITSILKNSGAAEIHWRIASPPIKNPCYMGVDFATKKELIFNEAQENIEVLKELIGGADSLRYLTHKQLISAITGKDISITGNDESEFYVKTKHCGACFTGRYPLNIKGTFKKN